MNLLMFDMDGTLLNSGIMVANTINHVRKELGFKPMEKDFILHNANDPDINTSLFFYQTEKFTEEQSVLFGKYYSKNCLKNLELYDGIKELLEDLKKDFTLTVATNANSLYASKMLNHLGILSYFDSILGFNDVIKSKPNPEMIYKLLDIHNTHKSRAQVIGDSHKDIIAASKAGVSSVLVNWGFSKHKYGAIQTVQELKKEIYKNYEL